MLAVLGAGLPFLVAMDAPWVATQPFKLNIKERFQPPSQPISALTATARPLQPGCLRQRLPCGWALSIISYHRGHFPGPDQRLLPMDRLIIMRSWMPSFLPIILLAIGIMASWAPVC
jgi:hypothetical protein